MHEKFLLAALDQAKLGRGSCAPNPSVGAVAVHNGKIIAQAWHKGVGTPHAEQLLLAQLNPKMPEVSLYITLEPCNHWGRTPPCVEAIINYGIEKVFFAFTDPNPLVIQNESVAQLQQHGIEVTHIPLAEIDAFYKSYTYWMQTGKPFVTVKIAQGFDGKIGYASGERAILSNSLCAQFTHNMRANSDVILTSAQTIKADNPSMNVRINDKEYAKPLAIIDSRLQLTPDMTVFSKASHCHIFHNPDLDNFVSESSAISYFPVDQKNGAMDLEKVICHLGQLGYHDVWVEAGGALFSSLHKQGLVNRTYVYLVPQSLSSKAVSAYQDDYIFARKHNVSWHALGDNMLACLDWLEDECLPG